MTFIVERGEYGDGSVDRLDVHAGARRRDAGKIHAPEPAWCSQTPVALRNDCSNSGGGIFKQLGIAHGLVRNRSRRRDHSQSRLVLV